MKHLRMSTLFRLCLASCVALSFADACADDWPQWRGLNRDGVWHETGIVDTFSGPQIEHKWRAEISNGYSGPTVADGRVYLTDHILEPVQMERVLCFDEETGEPLWTHEYKCEYRVSYPDGPREGLSMFSKDQGVTWSHPAFANKHVFIRNDFQLICASLASD